MNKIKGLIIFIIVIFLGGVSYFGAKLYFGNLKVIPFHDYFNIEIDTMQLIFEDTRMNLINNPIKIEKEVFIPVNFVKDYLDNYIFWDEVTKKLTITTNDKVIRMKAEELTSYVNDIPTEINLPVYEENGVAYMPSSMLTELYNVEITYDEENNYFVTIDMLDKVRNKARLEKKANLRYYPSKESNIELKLPENEELFVYAEEENYTRVRTDFGMLGYVETKYLTDFKVIEPVIKEEIATNAVIPIEGKINLLWDYVGTYEQNKLERKKIVHEGINVISPTWFTFDLDTLNGDLINIADKSYVDWAHQNGYNVWPRLIDEKASVGLHVLSNTDYREHIIKQLLAYVALYDLDGINVDLEQIVEDASPYFLQFLRELSPYMKQEGVVLSVDMYVPTWTKYYNRTEVQKVVDFICVMTYDEFSGASEEAGPVASYEFVRKGIMDTLEEVPNEKVIMGLPFYSRIWKNDKITQTLGMEATKNMFQKEGAEFTWDESLKLYYATFEKVEDGEVNVYETWIEEPRAIEEKMQIVNEFELAGVASWARGLQVESVFEVIDRKLNE